MKKRLRLLQAVLVVMLWGGVLSAGISPTPGEIAAAWSAMSGGSPAKVVYWRGGAVKVMDLTDGSETTVISQVDPWGVPKDILQSDSWGPYPCWSPDGTRIYFFNQDNDWSHWIVNEDGTNAEQIWPADSSGYWFLSWYDNDTVVMHNTASGEDQIVLVDINADNTPGATQVIVDTSVLYGTGRSYVTASGNYAAWTDGSANVPTGGGHRSIVRNWQTGEEMEVIARDDDACDICIKPDGSGTAVYCHANHFNATCKTFQAGINPSTELFVWASVQGEQFHYLRWSQCGDYICYNDDRQLSLSNQRAYIRKVPDGTDWMFLGYGIWGPDVWVDPAAPDTEPPQVIADSIVINGTASDTQTTPVVRVQGVETPLDLGEWSSEQMLSSFYEEFSIEADDASNTTTITLTVDVQ